jgi:RNA polymerase sigma factor (sigma-70 family)
MVLGVCKRVIANIHDAEDALQAVFLVLAKKAASIAQSDLVGNRLYGVAYRTALQARVRLGRRRAREIQVKDMPQPTVSSDMELHELHQALNLELNKLPDKYRVPIVLCDLEGRPRKDVAGRLKVPEGRAVEPAGERPAAFGAEAAPAWLGPVGRGAGDGSNAAGGYTDRRPAPRETGMPLTFMKESSTSASPATIRAPSGCPAGPGAPGGAHGSRIDWSRSGPTGGGCRDRTGERNPPCVGKIEETLARQAGTSKRPRWGASARSWSSGDRRDFETGVGRKAWRAPSGYARRCGAIVRKILDLAPGHSAAVAIQEDLFQRFKVQA